MNPSFLLLGSLLSALGAQVAKPDSSRTQRSFRFVYSAAVPEVPAGAKQVRLWVPVPVDTPDQTISRLGLTVKSTSAEGSIESTTTAPTPAKLIDGSQAWLSWIVRDIAGGLGRSVCVESPGAPIELTLSFDVLRYESKGGGQASPEELAELQQPDRMIPLDGKVAAIAASLETPEDAKQAAHALYLHTLERMKYDKPEGDKNWGRGDAEWACDARFGNCTDFHSYFIGLARTKGLPARFEMGFSIPGGAEKEAKVGGYHCWAHVWIDGQGWLPVDISEADRNPDRAAYFFGTLDASRVTMTGGRDLVLDPSPAEGALNFFVYPYAEIDGRRFDGVTKAFKRVNP